jgi:hypothetical protein
MSSVPERVRRLGHATRFDGGMEAERAARFKA